jgi:cysteinyl-tRNA synthetase
MGMTDVDDKIIRRAAEKKCSMQELAVQQEEYFWKDMTALGVRHPAVITRVSEHIPEIASFIESILLNGFGYIANGSVYFDSQAFKKNRRGQRAFASMEAHGVAANDQEEEHLKEKRHFADFALWKAAKAGEPSWDSPWGPGRPGWHIECSAMSCSIFDARLDVHAGGIDLKFPHHENEVAQCLACFPEVEQWPNYFLHTGHLHIQGRKMSKSLKNFISVKDFLKEHTATDLRLLCLLNRYENSIDCSPERWQETGAFWKKLYDFRRLAAELGRQAVSPIEKWTEAERTLNDSLLASSQNIHTALCDNFDTQTAVLELSALVSAFHEYLAHVGLSAGRRGLLGTVTAYVDRMTEVFGLPLHSSGSADSSAAEARADKAARSFATFRAQVRQSALKRDVAAADKLGEVLKACDAARAESFPALGYRLDDQKEGRFTLLKNE